ncbi:MAG: transketolase C-terminal domain-containing protein, partial [Allosphingosinicella sp.]
IHRHWAVEAADLLAAEGIGDIEVIDLRTISPLDTDTVLESVRHTGRCLVVHEDNHSFGVGAEVAATVAEEAFYDLDAPVARVCSAEVPIPYAKHLEEAALPSVDGIVAVVRKTIGR